MKIKIIICMHDFCNMAAVNKDYCHQTAKCHAASLSFPPQSGMGARIGRKKKKVKFMG